MQTFAGHQMDAIYILLILDFVNKIWSYFLFVIYVGNDISAVIMYTQSYKVFVLVLHQIFLGTVFPQYEVIPVRLSFSLPVPVSYRHSIGRAIEFIQSE